MKKATLFALIGLMFLLVGCSNVDIKPSGDPKEVINAYFQGIKDGNADAAYETLAEANKKVCSKEDFSLWLDLDAESYSVKEFKVESIGEVKDLKIEKNTYKHAVQFTVSQTLKDYFEDKEKPLTFKRYVVNDNGTWKVFREDFDIKERIAEAYYNIGLMYQDGKGKEKDSIKSLEYYKKVLEYSPDSYSIYYGIGYIYNELGRYDEALKNIKTYIEKENDKKGQSDGYNIIGNIYLSQLKTSKAKEAYKKALELDPDNEYAKTNLNSIR